VKTEMTEEENFDEIDQVVLDLYEKSKAVKITVITPYSTIEVNRPIEEVVREGYPFNEAHRYLKNAKRRIKAKTPEGYSDCKANCRNALDSMLQALTGKEKVREAIKELHIQRILGEREEEFVKTFGDLLIILHRIDSKKGSHPPMTRNVHDAKLALNLTEGILEYIISQATLQRD